MEFDRERITLALREYNAAQNSLSRAHSELTEALPEGVIILHCLPGETDSCKVFWTYVKTNRGTIASCAEARGTNGIVVEAPAPGVEYLPHLR